MSHWQFRLVKIYFQVDQVPLLFGMTTITGTAAGGLADTQECMDFCAKNNIVPETELVHNTTDISANKKYSTGSKKRGQRLRD